MFYWSKSKHCLRYNHSLLKQGAIINLERFAHVAAARKHIISRSVLFNLVQISFNLPKRQARQNECHVCTIIHKLADIGKSFCDQTVAYSPGVVQSICDADRHANGGAPDSAQSMQLLFYYLLNHAHRYLLHVANYAHNPL